MAIRRLVTPLTSLETYRALLFQILGAALGTAGIVALCVSWGVAVSLAFTPLILVVLPGVRGAVGVVVRAHGALAEELLGVRVRPAIMTPGTNLWNRSLNILRDRAFWRQQAYLLMTWPLTLLPLVPLSLGIQTAALPLYYEHTAGDDLFGGVLRIDTLGEALLVVPVGALLVVCGLYASNGVARVIRLLAARLLGDSAPVRTPARVIELRRRGLAIHAGVSASVGLLLVVIWATTPHGHFWPIWPLEALGLVLALHAWVVTVLERPDIRRRTGDSMALAIHAGASFALWLFLVGIWAATDDTYFWPVWPLLGLGIAVGAHAAAVVSHRGRRIEELETTRAGAVDMQETELRRIERDLHDGAQARLVALGMSLGMAEEKLATDPEGARKLLTEARTGAREALEELRDLARGIHPPILTDRGLEAAIRALVARSPLRVDVSVELPERPRPAVETAAYFVVAEALANAGKHADARQVGIRIATTGDTLVAQVTDDGAGGADPAGKGLTGLRRRVEALDGELRVASPPGGPTTVTVELPCES